MSRIAICGVLIALVFLALSCKEIQGPQGPPGQGIESLTDPRITPRVLYTYPTANSVGPYADLVNNMIQVRFNKIMDRTSVKRALSISSPLTNTRVDSQYVYSVGGDVYYLYPTDNLYSYYSYRWKLGETYTLSIAASAMDINGNYLVPGYSMTFVPEPFFRVVRVVPANGATGVEVLNSSIYLFFNSPVDTALGSSVHSFPQIPGKWYYPYYRGQGIDSTVLGYEISAKGIKEHTTYTVTIDPSAHDKYGNTLAHPFSSSFTTVSFDVLSTYPPDGGVLQSLGSGVSVYFSNALDTSSVRRAFRILPTQPGYIYAYPGNPNFSFYPSPEFIPDTIYTVTIDTSIRSWQGGKPSDPYSFSFSTPAFHVTYTYPADGDVGVSRSLSYVYVAFNSVIDTGSVASSFSAPGMAGSYGLYEGSSSFYFYPSNPLLANATYTVTIFAGLRSETGHYLKAPYVFSFTTGD